MDEAVGQARSAHQPPQARCGAFQKSRLLSQLCLQAVSLGWGGSLQVLSPSCVEGRSPQLSSPPLGPGPRLGAPVN